MSEALVTLGRLPNMPVRFKYEPGYEGRMYARNGDPGEPSIDPELWITHVRGNDGVWIDAEHFPEEWLTEAEQILLQTMPTAYERRVEHAEMLADLRDDR